MFAKRKSDGKVIEVTERSSRNGEKIYTADGTFYRKVELDFNVEESEEETIDGWVARDTVDGELNIFTEIPETCNRGTLHAYWVGGNGCLQLPQKCEKLFKSLDSETIQEITITIKPKKKQ